MKKHFLFLAFLAAIAGGFLFSANAAMAEEITIDQDTVWGDGDVVVVGDDESLTVMPGVTLTLEPGSVIKMGKDAMIGVLGRLDINGTAAKPVRITSLSDDSVGGDTNNDGNETAPAKGDWAGIIVGPMPTGAEVEVDYAVISYGGGYDSNPFDYIQIVNAESFLVRHSNLIDNDQRIRVIGANEFSISDSNIFNPSQCIPLFDCEYISYGIANQTGEVLRVTGNYWGHPEGPTTLADVMNGQLNGTLLMDGGFDFVPFVSEPIQLFTETSSEPNPVILIPGIMGSWDFSGQWELDPILNTYDDLWEAFKAAGYEEGKTLFAFPYDWHFSNVSNTDELMRKVQEVKGISGSDRVDLVGHSMGGLLARAYVESIYYQDDVDKMVFLASPHRGATKAYLMWEGGDLGENMRDDIDELLLELYANYNGYDSIFRFVRGGVKSVQDLLPTYDYLKDGQEFRNYPNNYPNNYFLDLLNKPENMAKLDDVRILNVVADNSKNNTLNYIRVEDKHFDDGRWEHGYPANYGSWFQSSGLEFGRGDETVPWLSNGNFFDNELIINNTNHGDVVTDAQQDVIEFLTGKRPEQIIKSGVIDKYFMVRIFSPADFLVTAPDGSMVGTTADGQIVNQIDGAYYVNNDEMEFALLPEPAQGDYKIDLVGTGDGSYRLSLDKIGDDSDEQRNFFGSIATGQEQEFNLSYSDGEQLGDLEPVDETAPSVNILAPSASSTFWRQDELKVEFSAQDDFSGISSTVVMVDGQQVATSSGTVIDLFDYPAGTHRLSVSASDVSGNAAEASLDFEITADLSSTIRDIEQYYKTKLLSRDGRNRLLPPLEQLERKLKAVDLLVELARKAKRVVENARYLNQRLKDKAMEKADQAVFKLLDERADIISDKMKEFDKQLKKIWEQGKVLEPAYGIIKADSDYLKNNL